MQKKLASSKAPLWMHHLASPGGAAGSYKMSDNESEFGESAAAAAAATASETSADLATANADDPPVHAQGTKV